LQNHERCRQHQQFSRWQSAEHEQHEAGDAVVEQHIAAPQQHVAVEQAEGDQPERASKIQIGRAQIGGASRMTLQEQ
jgi:hypothetical protein